MLTRAGLLDAAVVRLTNVYGPRMALDVVCQGFLSTFIRRMVLKQTIEIFGDGTQLRDPMYVDDAVEAFLTLGRAQNLRTRTFNVGGPEANTVATIAHMASQIAGCSEPVFRPFPAVRKSIDIGSAVCPGIRPAAGAALLVRRRHSDSVQQGFAPSGGPGAIAGTEPFKILDLYQCVAEAEPGAPVPELPQPSHDVHWLHLSVPAGVPPQAQVCHSQF
jgi:nucleoside-diphosphate-sugar epimerase